MKKTLLILCALVCNMLAFAQEGYYTDWMHLVVNDTDEGVVKSTVSVEYTEGTTNTIDLTLHDFSVDIYMTGWQTVYLGDVTVHGIQLGDEVDGVASISCTANTDVDYPDVDQTYASSITSVSVDMTGEVSETKLRVSMGITVHIKLMGLIDMGDYLVTATFGYDYGEYLVVNTETGNYLGGGLDWGTHATEIGKPQFFSFIEQTDGTYTLNGNQNGSTSIGWDADYAALYIDAVHPLTWELIATDGGYYIATEEGYLTGNGFQVAASLKDKKTDATVWKLVTLDEAIADMDKATADNPVDVTPLIPAPEPKRNDWGGSWTATGYGVSADPNNFSFGQDWYTASCAESLRSTNGFDAHQTFSLPKAGFYTLTAQAFYRSDGSGKVLPSIYVTTGTNATGASGSLMSVPIPEITRDSRYLGQADNMENAYQEFLLGLHPVSITFMIDNEGDEITVGFDSNVAEDNEMWTIFGELGLTYSGEDYYPELTAVTGMMNADVEATQTAALSAYASSPSAATYAAALNAVQAATESIAFYEEVTAALATGDYEAVVATFDDAGQAAFQSDYLDAYEARTLTDQTVEDGLAAACKLQITEGADMSYALKNSGKWTNAIGATNFQLCPTLPTAHEIWSASAWTITGRDVTEKEAIYKQIEDLPAGTYTLSFYAYGSEAEDVDKRPLAYVNGVETEQEVKYLANLGTAWTDASLYTFVCEVGSDGILQFGMKTQGKGNWYVMEECSLTLGVMPKAVVHDETTFDHWSISGNSGGSFQYNTWSGEADPSGMVTPFIEYWVGTGYQLSDATISHQTLSDLTPGFYTVSLDMRAFNEGSLNKIKPGIVLSANGTSVDISLGTHDVFNKESAEAYGTFEVPCMVGADGTLDIAITLTDCNCDWLAFKNLVVTYTGTEYELPAVADIKAVEGDMSTAKDEAQQAAIEAYTASQSPTNAIALYQALADAQLCANFYADVAATLKELDLDEAGQEAWAATENGAAYEGKTLEVTDMTDTYVTAVKAQTTAGSDMTYALLNSGEWSADQGNGPANYSTFAIETYITSGEATEGTVLYKTIEDLTPGTYTVSFYVAANMANGVSGDTGEGITQAFANGEVEAITVGTLSGADITSLDDMTLVSITCTVDEDGVLEFGLQNVADGGNWFLGAAASLTLLEGPFEPTTVSYTDNLHVVVAGEEEVIVTTVDVEYTAANVINFVIHDLAVAGTNVGNVTVTGITLEDAGDGVYTFTYSGSDVTVSGGDYDSMMGWLSFSVTITGEITEEKLRANMDIDVKMFGMSLLSITADFGYSYEEYLVVNAATGNYLGGGLDWGTHATEIGKPQFFTFAEQADGTYNINGNQGGTSIGWSEPYDGIYIDAVNPLTWTVTESGEGYTFYNATYGYLTGHGFQKAVTIEQSLSDAAVWKLVTKDEILASMADATLDNPVDVTALIPAPEPKRNNWGGSWKATGYGVSAVPSNYTFGQDGNTASCAESYCSDNGFDIRQTIPSLPAGYYVLNAQAFYRNEGSGTVVPVMYIDDETKEISVLTTTANNMESAYQEFLQKLHTMSMNFFVDEDDTDVLVGFASLTTTSNGMWTIFGELELLYYGPDAPVDNSYQFVCTDWVSIDSYRVYQDNISYDEDSNTITVIPRTDTNDGGLNNVALANGSAYEGPFSTADMYVTNEQNWFVVVASDIDTGLTSSALWWMNGDNDGTFYPDYIVELESGEILVAWDLTATGIDTNMQDEENYLNGWTGFGLTSTSGTSVVSDINFYTWEDAVATYPELAGATPTEIKNVENETAVEGIYDMSGRKVSKAVKGVYIIDGKKVLVK